MTTLSAAVASIPPTSYLVKHLHLKSSLPRKDGDVTVCTQCSLDRLDKLEAQTTAWSGVICAAVMCPCPCRAESLRDAKEYVRALHRRVEARRGPCRLDIILVAHDKRTNSGSSPCKDPWKYPINALRNVALRSAATELVILLDVDFLPGVGIQEQLWKADVYSGYLRACTDLRRLVILPAVEETPVIHETTDGEAEASVLEEKDYLQSALQIVSGGKASVEKLWALGKLRTLAADKYPRGHGPTDTGRWISSDATYEVQYEVDFEPYFLCSRRLVPWYDERFTGYGKNKIIHAFHTAVLDFRFWIHPEWFVVHVHHEGSMAWEATLGSDPHASKRLSEIKRLYAIAKHELLSLPTHSGVHLPSKPCACTVVPKSLPSDSWISWKLGQSNGREDDEQMGHWNDDDHPSTLLQQSSNKKYIQALYDLRYHFCVSKLRPLVGKWPLRSKLPRNPNDITLVTVATADRLQRLSAQCRRWKGVICAAIYAPPNTDVKDLERKLLALHLEVENAGTCRLDVTLMELVDVEKRNSCKPFGRRGMPSVDLCPINGLRNAALELATTDLVLILDVDLLPAPSLNDCFLDEQQYKCLFRMVMDDRTAVVVPTFEYTTMARDASSNGNGNGEDGHLSQRPKKSSGKGKKASEKNSAIQEVKYISDTEEMTGKGVHAICNGLNNGDLRGFHVKHYPAGHSPTDFEKWRRVSESSNEGDQTCCEVCRSYDITFAEGFEPFIICSRKLIPIFDERFRGYGFDKVTFFYHLHLSGFRFRVLLHSFALDILHPKSKDWMKTFGPSSDPLQHIRVKALYQRAKREICVVTGGSALANHVVDELPVHLMGSAKPPGLLSKSRKQFRTASVPGESKSRSTLDGLQLAWEGVIHRQYSQRKNSLEFNNAEGEPSSSVPSEEDETKTSLGTADIPSSVPSYGGDFSISIGSGITDLAQRDHATRLFSSCFGHNSFWAQSIAYAASELKTFDSSNAVESLEEFDWDITGWDLKCKSDSLLNCSVVKAPPKDSSSEKEWFQTGGYWLRIFMSAGSWSPQASRLAGITAGGVSVRSVLPIRALKQVVVRYMVRFPSSFEWVKGGTLPGLWVSDVLQANFGWRRGGEGHLSTALVGLSKTESDQHSNSSFTQKTSKLSRPFYFVPEQWHALQISASLVDQRGTRDQDGTHVESNGQAVNRRSLSRHGSAKDGVVVELRAFVDFELISTISYPYVGGRNLSTNRQDPGLSLGLLLSCYFGGKTQDWASTEDTHIDFSQFEIWTD